MTRSLMVLGAGLLQVSLGLACTVTTDSSTSAPATSSASCTRTDGTSCATYVSLTSDQASSLNSQCSAGDGSIGQGTVTASCPTTGVLGTCAYTSTAGVSVKESAYCGSQQNAVTCAGLTSKGVTNPVWTAGIDPSTCAGGGDDGGGSDGPTE